MVSELGIWQDRIDVHQGWLGAAAAATAALLLLLMLLLPVGEDAKGLKQHASVEGHLSHSPKPKTQFPSGLRLRKIAKNCGKLRTPIPSPCLEGKLPLRSAPSTSNPNTIIAGVSILPPLVCVLCIPPLNHPDNDTQPGLPTVVPCPCFGHKGP